MNEDLLTTNQIINSNKKYELIVPTTNTIKYKFFISSDNRDFNIHPYAGNFSINLPIEITNVSDIKLLDINIKKKYVFNKYNILEWQYNNTPDIPIEEINSIAKIDKYFNLTRVLYGYTKQFETNGNNILFNFKSNNEIHIALFGEGKADNYNLLKAITLTDTNSRSTTSDPVRILFRSINGEQIYKYTINSISQFTPENSNMKKVYILKVNAFDDYNKPFNNYFEKNGHILMYIYHPITPEISKYIPIKYNNDGYLGDYIKLLKNPTIYNNAIFDIKVDYPNLSDILEQEIVISNTEIDELLNIDIPKNNKFSTYINDISTLKECKTMIETVNIIHNFNYYTWKFTYNTNIRLEHFRVLTVTLTYNLNKVFINNNELDEHDVIYYNDKYYSLYRDSDKNLFYYNKPSIKKSITVNINVVSNCTVTENSTIFFRTLQINNTGFGSNWNNFTISKKVPIHKIFVYGIHNQIVLKVSTIGDFTVGDKIVIRDSNIKNKGVLQDNIPKFISKIQAIKDGYLVTIDLDTFFVGNNKNKEFYEYGSGGYIAKIANPRELVYTGDIYFNLKNCNYIDILNNSDISKVFSVINKNNNIIGGQFQTETYIKNLEKLDIDLVKTNNKPYLCIDTVSMLLEITKVKKVDR